MAKSYLSQLLGDGESLALVTGPHWVVFYRSIWKPLILLLVVAVAAIASLAYDTYLPPAVRTALPWAELALAILAVLIMLYRYLAWKSDRYVITSRRVIRMEGILNKHVFDSSLDFINDLHMDQSLIGRIFGFGDIELLTASEETGDRQTYRCVSRPKRFVRGIEDQRERRRRSVLAQTVGASGAAEGAPAGG